MADANESKPDPVVVERCKTVDTAMKVWRQGDVVDGLPMLWYCHRTMPLTDTSMSDNPDDEGALRVVESDAGPMIVVTQTCDIRKTCGPGPNGQPYVQLAPVVDLAGKVILSEAQGGHAVQFAPVPALGDTWFADLNRCVSVEKAVLCLAVRREGCRTQRERDAFAKVAGTHRQRFAFPDGAETVFDPLRKYLRKKRDKNTAEAMRINEVLEIRAREERGWEADTCELTISFLVDPSALPPNVEEAATPEVKAFLADEKNGWAALKVATQLDADKLTLGDRSALWQRLVECWCARCKSTYGVTFAGALAVSMAEFSVWQARHEPRLELDNLTNSDDDDDNDDFGDVEDT